MLFHVTWTFHNPSEENQKRTLSLFQKWTPGPGQFQAFYGFADGTGGIALIEVETTTELAKNTCSMDSRPDIYNTSYPSHRRILKD